MNFRHGSSADQLHFFFPRGHLLLMEQELSRSSEVIMVMKAMMGMK
jgi:hypothetical protein